MTWTEVRDAYLPSDDTVWMTARSSISWLWDPPTPLPEIRDPLPRHTPIAPHIHIRYFKTFTGHKFGFRGKKCL